MSTPFRAKTFGEILGHDKGDSPGAMVYRRFLELNVRTDEQFRQLPKADRYLWLAYWLGWQVQNGGIDQFIWNSRGDYAMETLEALQAIGAADTHNTLKEACDLFSDGRPSEDRELRQEQMHAIRTRSDGRLLDDVIAGELDRNLSELMWEYYRTHREKQGPKGDGPIIRPQKRCGNKSEQTGRHHWRRWKPRITRMYWQAS